MSDDTHSKPRIEQIENGPLRYLRGTDPETRGTLVGADGAELPIRDKVLLCRCGRSERKPFCDGSHVGAGFSSERKWKTGAGSVVDHAGARVTIHDNRALCAHVEYCTAQLPAVFDRSREPWIDPDGASAEEIIAACMKCPSGALSCTVDGVLYRNYDRPARVIAHADGPYFLEGGIEVVGEPFSEGYSTEHCTLCRCGESTNKPLCNGRHHEIGFVNRKD